jgi:hypothetical protein
VIWFASVIDLPPGRVVSMPHSGIAQSLTEWYLFRHCRRKGAKAGTVTNSIFSKEKINRNTGYTH